MSAKGFLIFMNLLVQLHQHNENGQLYFVICEILVVCGKWFSSTMAMSLVCHTSNHS